MFSNESDLIQFLYKRWEARINSVDDTPESILKFIFNNNTANTKNNYNKIDNDVREGYIQIVKDAINIFNGVKTP